MHNSLSCLKLWKNVPKESDINCIPNIQQTKIVSKRENFISILQSEKMLMKYIFSIIYKYCSCIISNCKNSQESIIYIFLSWDLFWHYISQTFNIFLFWWQTLDKLGSQELYFGLSLLTSIYLLNIFKIVFRCWWANFKW